MCIYKYKYIYIYWKSTTWLFTYLEDALRFWEQKNFFLTSPRLHWHARANTHPQPIQYTTQSSQHFHAWTVHGESDFYPMFPLQKMFVKLTRFQLVSWCFMHFTVHVLLLLPQLFRLLQQLLPPFLRRGRYLLARRSRRGHRGRGRSVLRVQHSSDQILCCLRKTTEKKTPAEASASGIIMTNQLLQYAQYECQYIGRWHIIWEYFLVAQSWCVLLIWACRGVQHSAAAVKSPVAAVKMHLALCSPTAPLLMRMPLVSAFSLAPSALLAPWVDLNNAPWVAHLDRTHFLVGHPKKQYII